MRTPLPSSWRLAATAAVLAVAATASVPHGQPDTPPRAPAAQTGTTVAAPAPSPAPPGASPLPRGTPDLDRSPGEAKAGSATDDAASRPAPAPPVPDSVETHHPDLLLRETDGGAALLAAHATEGVEHAAATALFDGIISTGDGQRATVSVLAVDPAAFRPLTPDVTAQARGVWQRLAEGDVVVRHDVAHELDLSLGGTTELATATAPAREIRVGALASNGAPPLADVVVPWSVAGDLGVTTPDTLVVAVGADHAASSVGDRLVEGAGGEQEVRSVPQTRQAGLAGAGSDAIEPFSYTDLGDGMIAIDPAWVSRWIVTVDLPYLGQTRCHRVMVPQLFAALQEIEARGLVSHFDPGQFAGCWVPRHIDWDPSKPLSMHAWGLAVDINAQDNPLGQTPVMDPRIVGVFEKWGFEWGGRWARPDGMHFELDRIVTVE